MITSQINAALHLWLCQPLTPAEANALAVGAHSVEVGASAIYRIADEKLRRNWAQPWNFTDSLDACRVVENRLSDRQFVAYVQLFLGDGLNWRGNTLNADAKARATALAEVLGLVAE